MKKSFFAPFVFLGCFLLMGCPKKDTEIYPPIKIIITPDATYQTDNFSVCYGLHSIADTVHLNYISSTYPIFQTYLNPNLDFTTFIIKTVNRTDTLTLHYQREIQKDDDYIIMRNKNLTVVKHTFTSAKPYPYGNEVDIIY